MTPFRTSLTARMLSLAVFAIVSCPGLAILLDANLHHAIPLCTIAAITLSLFGMIVGTAEYPGTVLLLSILLPLALWGYFMGLEAIVMGHKNLAWALCAAGFVPLIATIAAERTVEKALPASSARA